MATKTINLSYEEDSATILILRGIHQIEPIGNFTLMGTAGNLTMMFVENEEVINLIYACARAYKTALKDRDTSDRNVLWRYVHDELIGDEHTGFEHDDDEDTRTFAERYVDASR